MAFSVTSFKAYGLPTYEAVTAQFVQCVEINVTRGATSDTAVDIGNVAGTFWDNADGDATGLAALAQWKSIVGKSRALLNVTAPQIESTFTRVVSGATGAQYQLVSSTVAGLAYTLVSGQALGSFSVYITIALNAGELPIKYGV